MHKYGGTSVGDVEKIEKIAQRVIDEKRNGNQMVVVVSAMGKTTDHLVAMSHKISDNPDKRDLDMILSTGEQITVALLSMAFKKYGHDAISLTGFQAGIKTHGPHTKTKIRDIDITKIRQLLTQEKIVVVAGFQGINESGDITTLGRGGSDTTAVALAAKLNCDCHIYTDVEGIYTVDPRVYQAARKLHEISYIEMMELASLGAGVIEARAIEIGCKYSVPIYVAKSCSEKNGTYIKEMVDTMEEKVITGLSVSDDVLMITIHNIKFELENIAYIFEQVAQANINIDMISQTAPVDNRVSISFTATKADLFALREVIQKIQQWNSKIIAEIEEDITKVSVVGIGMMNQSGVTGKLFRLLANHIIPFRQITTSEISISYTIHSKNKERMVRVLAKAFDL